VCNRVDWTVDGHLNGHVRWEEVELRIRQKMGDVVYPPGGQIVNADDRIVPLDQPFAQMRADKAGTPSDDYAHDRDLRPIRDRSS